MQLSGGDFGPQKTLALSGFRTGSALLASSGRRDAPQHRLGHRAAPGQRCSRHKCQWCPNEKSLPSLQPSGPKHVGFQRRSTWGFVLEKNLGSRWGFRRDGRKRHKTQRLGSRLEDSTPPTAPPPGDLRGGRAAFLGDRPCQPSHLPPRAAQSGRPEGGGLSPALHSGCLLADPQGRTRVPAAGLAWP